MLEAFVWLALGAWVVGPLVLLWLWRRRALRSRHDWKRITFTTHAGYTVHSISIIVDASTEAGALAVLSAVPRHGQVIA